MYSQNNVDGLINQIKTSNLSEWSFSLANEEEQARNDHLALINDVAQLLNSYVKSAGDTKGDLPSNVKVITSSVEEESLSYLQIYQIQLVHTWAQILLNGAKKQDTILDSELKNKIETLKTRLIDVLTVSKDGEVLFESRASAVALAELTLTSVLDIFLNSPRERHSKILNHLLLIIDDCKKNDRLDVVKDIFKQYQYLTQKLGSSTDLLWDDYGIHKFVLNTLNRYVSDPSVDISPELLEQWVEIYLKITSFDAQNLLNSSMSASLENLTFKKRFSVSVFEKIKTFIDVVGKKFHEENSERVLEHFLVMGVNKLMSSTDEEQELLLDQLMRVAEKVEGFLDHPQYSPAKAIEDCYMNYIGTYNNSLKSVWESLWTKDGKETSLDGTEWEVFSIPREKFFTFNTILIQFPAVEADSSIEPLINNGQIGSIGSDNVFHSMENISFGKYEVGPQQENDLRFLPDPDGGIEERSPFQILGVVAERGDKKTILKIPTNESFLKNWEKLKKAVEIKGQELGKYYDDHLAKIHPTDKQEIERISVLSANAKSWASRLGTFDIVPSIGIEGDMEYAKAYIDGKIIFSDDKERIHDLVAHIIRYVYNKLTSALTPEIQVIEGQFRNDLRIRYDKVLENEKRVADPSFEKSHPDGALVKKYLPIMKSYMGAMADINSNFFLIGSNPNFKAPFITNEPGQNGENVYLYNESYIRDRFENEYSVNLNKVSPFGLYYFPRVFNNELITTGSYFPTQTFDNKTTIRDFIHAWKV